MRIFAPCWMVPGVCLVRRADFEVTAVTDFLSSSFPRALRDNQTGPASLCTEFTDFSDAVETHRGAVCLCRFAGAEYRRSVGLLTNVQALSSDMYFGWPSFNTLDNVSQHVGPLSGFLRMLHNTHPSLRGPAAKGGFKSLPKRSDHGFGLASSAKCKTLSFIALRKFWLRTVCRPRVCVSCR